MRRVEDTIKEAELIASSPEAVAAYLKERGSRLSADELAEEGDEEFEKSLLDRENTLIELALARHCRHSDTAKTLFFKEPTEMALRLSVLSNRVIGRDDLGMFPRILFDHDGQLASYLGTASDQELLALFENPKLEDDFLQGFLEGGAYWQAISERQRLIALVALSTNDRMKTPYDDSYMDGFAEYNSYEKVFGAAWKLAATAPVSRQWASVLSKLYYQVFPEAHSIDKPLELAARWFPQDEESSKRESEHNERGYLSDYQGVRKGLAKLALSKDPYLLGVNAIGERGCGVPGRRLRFHRPVPRPDPDGLRGERRARPPTDAP
ncbi:hypothetical protein [Marinobacterium aestuariivivens]|uniref:Uncharacterized protein n=1 Tax=Marinobacterium aestuariivivens TaxID=1698799 RepID=A0ABW2AB45_9GAMM